MITSIVNENSYNMAEAAAESTQFSTTTNFWLLLEYIRISYAKSASMYVCSIKYPQL